MNNLARTSALPEVRMQLDNMAAQFAAVLPAHIPPKKFVRVVITAIQNNPDLLQVDRRSLFNSCMQAATDGLIPDGRLGAIVVYKDRKKGIKTARWMPMIAGIRQKVRNSGEISDWTAHVVHENDKWDYQEGDDAHILHKPVRGDRGPVIAAYSIAKLRGGEISREWMWIEELNKVREMSQADWGPWSSWTDEMYKKTVARRHSKVLPTSTDIESMFARETENEPAPAVQAKPVDDDAARIATMTDALDRLSTRKPTEGLDQADDDLDDHDEQGEVIEHELDGEYSETDEEIRK